GDGGPVERPPAIDVDWGDAPPIPDSGPAGSGGRGGYGGNAGVGGTGGAGGTGGGVSMCSNSSPDRQTDISNCGTCFNSCLVPNSTPSCVAGMCRFACF